MVVCADVGNGMTLISLGVVRLSEFGETESGVGTATKWMVLKSSWRVSTCMAFSSDGGLDGTGACLQAET